MNAPDDFSNVLVVDVLDTHGRVLQRRRFDVSAEARRFTVGRSPEASVMLDDPHVAGMHMAIEVSADGKLSVSDLGTQNGIIINGRRMLGVTDHPLAKRQLKLGRTVVRLHVASDELAPEMADSQRPAGLRRAGWIALLAGVVCLLFSFYFVWVEAPKDIIPPLIEELFASATVAAAWICIWSLLTRVMQGQWRWLAHAAIFLSVTAVFYLLQELLSLLWFALELPRIDWVVIALMVVASMVLVYQGLLNSSPMSRRSAALVGICLPLLFAIPAVWMVERGKNRDVNFIGANSDFYPQAFSLRESESIVDYLSAATVLRQNADDARKEADKLDLEEGDDSE